MGRYLVIDEDLAKLMRKNEVTVNQLLIGLKESNSTKTFVARQKRLLPAPLELGFIGKSIDCVPTLPNGTIFREALVAASPTCKRLLEELTSQRTSLALLIQIPDSALKEALRIRVALRASKLGHEARAQRTTMLEEITNAAAQAHASKGFDQRDLTRFAEKELALLEELAEKLTTDAYRGALSQTRTNEKLVSLLEDSAGLHGFEWPAGVKPGDFLGFAYREFETLLHGASTSPKKLIRAFQTSRAELRVSDRLSVVTQQPGYVLDLLATTTQHLKNRSNREWKRLKGMTEQECFLELKRELPNERSRSSIVGLFKKGLGLKTEHFTRATGQLESIFGSRSFECLQEIRAQLTDYVRKGKISESVAANYLRQFKMEFIPGATWIRTPEGMRRAVPFKESRNGLVEYTDGTAWLTFLGDQSIYPQSRMVGVHEGKAGHDIEMVEQLLTRPEKNAQVVFGGIDAGGELVVRQSVIQFTLPQDVTISIHTPRVNVASRPGLPSRSELSELAEAVESAPGHGVIHLLPLPFSTSQLAHSVKHDVFAALRTVTRAL